MSVRIIAGDLRGRRIELPADCDVRPTPDRAKVAVFNSLGGAVRDARVLDLCAGSGALGIEALSRGARDAAFLESDPAVARALRANLARLGLTDRTSVIVGDAVAWLERKSAREGAAEWDLLFADPPYSSDVLEGLLGLLASRPWIVAEAGWVVLEEGGQVAPALPANEFTERWRRAYGAAHLSLFLRTRNGVA